MFLDPADKTGNSGINAKPAELTATLAPAHDSFEIRDILAYQNEPSPAVSIARVSGWRSGTNHSLDDRTPVALIT